MLPKKALIFLLRRGIAPRIATLVRLPSASPHKTVKSSSLVLIILLAPFIVRDAFADSGDLINRLTDLQRVVSKAEAKSSQPDRLGPFGVDQYFTAIRNSVSRGDYASVQTALNPLRTASVSKEKDVANLLNKVDTALHEATTTQEAVADRAFESISTDVRSKVESRAPASDFDTILNELSKVAGPRNAYNYGENSSQGKLVALTNFVSRWQEYLVQSAEGNGDQAENALNELTRLAVTLPVVPRSELLALHADTAKLRDSQQMTNARRTSELVTRMQNLVDQAKTPADLDAFLADISTRRSSNNYQWSNNTDQVRQFVTKWQDYLAAGNLGNSGAAREILRGLSTDFSSAAIYPRSRLLERLNAPVSLTPGAPSGSLPTHLTLENVETFAAALSSRREGDPGGFYGMLIALVGVQRALKNGDPSVAFRVLNSQPMVAPPPYTEEFANASQRLLLEAIVEATKPGNNLRPNENETISSYLDRVMATARTKSDWQLASAVLDVKAKMGFLSGKTMSDVSGYQMLVAADNFDKAGQYAEAVHCYLASLRIGGASLPAAAVGEKLDAIKKSHPSEFELGEKLSQSTSISQPYQRFRPPGM